MDWLLQNPQTRAVLDKHQPPAESVHLCTCVLTHTSGKDESYSFFFTLNKNINFAFYTEQPEVRIMTGQLSRGLQCGHLNSVALGTRDPHKPRQKLQGKKVAQQEGFSILSQRIERSGSLQAYANGASKTNTWGRGRRST